MLAGDIATKMLQQALLAAREHWILSDEHFTVDGTLVEAWAGQKSFQLRVQKETGRASDSEDPGNPAMNFHGQERYPLVDHRS